MFIHFSKKTVPYPIMPNFLTFFVSGRKFVCYLLLCNYILVVPIIDKWKEILASCVLLLFLVF